MEKFRQLITRRSHPIDAVRCFSTFSYYSDVCKRYSKVRNRFCKSTAVLKN
ncbi:hypothetical protein LEP1GSC108_0510 [Leptospira weilii str. UI 13098]|uniref:Uncharacterized protein n=1 Tax=Leptospira weilii str. UI 13098 TaxID=1088542 RepID=M6PYM0_9LEPT|nr:hypothetical protein LEP1GSC108_0510 [Leptospira weilii str. UI 13098]